MNEVETLIAQLNNDFVYCKICGNKTLIIDTPILYNDSLGYNKSNFICEKCHLAIHSRNSFLEKVEKCKSL